jgi:hypothetical protein
MEDRRSWVVDGFSFYHEKDAKLARQERTKTEYLERYLDYSKPENIRIVYEKALKDRVFQTAVGITYLKHLQTYLIELHSVDSAKIPPIPLYPASAAQQGFSSEDAEQEGERTTDGVAGQATEPSVGQTTGRVMEQPAGQATEQATGQVSGRNPAAESQKSKKTVRASASFLLNIVLAVAVAVMFVLAFSSRHPNILNYERALKNRYAAWEQELTQRELAVREKELAQKRSEEG